MIRKVLIWTFLSAFWALLLLGGPASAASVGASPEGLASVSKPKSQLQSQVQSQPPLPPPVEIETSTTQKSDTAVFTRRPSVDSGLRYSSNDWLVNFISTPTSYILQRIRSHLFFNVAICLVVIYFYPKYPSLAIPMVGHSLLGSSLGLLLSYRTNSAYARFWEARGHWTKTKSTCRNLAIMIKTHIEPHSPVASARFLSQLAAYPGALMHLCLGGSAKLQDYVQVNIPQPESEEIFSVSPSLPGIAMLMELHRAIHDAAIESRTSDKNLEALHLNEVAHMLDVLMDCLSSCEKILRTPLPWTYSRHLSRFLTLYVGTLPFALIGTMNRGLTLATAFGISFCLLGKSQWR